MAYSPVNQRPQSIFEGRNQIDPLPKKTTGFPRPSSERTRPRCRHNSYAGQFFEDLRRKKAGRCAGPWGGATTIFNFLLRPHDINENPDPVHHQSPSPPPAQPPFAQKTILIRARRRDRPCSGEVRRRRTIADMTTRTKKPQPWFCRGTTPLPQTRQEPTICMKSRGNPPGNESS